MEDEIEVKTTDEKEPEIPVSFVEGDGETTVVIGDEKKGDKDNRDDERWRNAEANQNRLAADFADLRNRLAGVAGVPQGGSTATAHDPWQAQLDAISEQERALGIQWEAHKAARTLTPALLKEYDNKSRQLHQQRNDLAAQRAVQNILPQLQQMQQRNYYEVEYGDVRANQAATRWARGHYDMLVAQGAAEGPETVRQAMNAARRQFRIGNHDSSPTERERQQLTGFSANGRRNMEPKNNTVKMGKSEKVMAMAMYGSRFNGDEQKAYAQWAKGPGIRAQKAAQKARSANR